MAVCFYRPRTRRAGAGKRVVLNSTPCGACSWLSRSRAHSVTSRQIPPVPRLQVHPHSDLVALLQQEKALLSSYAWTDSTHGAARIPIERAIAIYVQEQRKKQATTPSTSPVKTQETRQ